MFGVYRTLLALMVVAAHIGGAWGLGGYAVFGFFVLSGYLMTFIMHETYGYTVKGVGLFLENRFFRIYPLYWAACAISVATITTSSISTEMLVNLTNDEVGMPDSLTGLLANILIVIPQGYYPVLILPAWALTVELCFYIAIALAVSRTRTSSWIWLCLGLTYTLLVNIIYGPNGRYMYYSIAAASLPFSIGSLIYHYRSEIIRRAPFFPHPGFLAILFLLMFGNVLFARLSGLRIEYAVTFYVSLVLQSLLVAALANCKPTGIWTRSLDAGVGRFSYPIYLLHMPLVLLVVQLGSPYRTPYPPLFFMTLPVLIATSWLLIKLIDEPMDRMRQNIKSRLRQRGSGQVPAA